MLTPQTVWGRTKVHQNSTYFCQRCGKKVASPAAFYKHLDAKHPGKGRGN